MDNFFCLAYRWNREERKKSAGPTTFLFLFICAKKVEREDSNFTFSIYTPTFLASLFVLLSSMAKLKFRTVMLVLCRGYQKLHILIYFCNFCNKTRLISAFNFVGGGNKSIESSQKTIINWINLVVVYVSESWKIIYWFVQNWGTE
jgi:hypothetical protein